MWCWFCFAVSYQYTLLGWGAKLTRHLFTLRALLTDEGWGSLPQHFDPRHSMALKSFRMLQKQKKKRSHDSNIIEVNKPHMIQLKSRKHNGDFGQECLRPSGFLMQSWEKNCNKKIKEHCQQKEKLTHYLAIASFCKVTKAIPKGCCGTISASCLTSSSRNFSFPQ